VYEPFLGYDVRQGRRACNGEAYCSSKSATWTLPPRVFVAKLKIANLS
jgi:hypothetical protein